MIADPQLLEEVAYLVELPFAVVGSFDPEFLELPAEISDKKLILSSAELLLKRLVQYLQQQDAGLNRLLLRLYHYEHTATQVTLGLRQNSRNYQHILDLLQQQLDKVQLPSKVNALRLSVKDILPLEACASNLFPAHILPQEKQQNDPEWESLLEQLQNRLGPDALQYLDMRDDHRPEFAWCYQRGVSESPAAYQLARPSWLLRTPTALRRGRNASSPAGGKTGKFVVIITWRGILITAGCGFIAI